MTSSSDLSGYLETFDADADFFVGYTKLPHAGNGGNCLVGLALSVLLKFRQSSLELLDRHQALFVVRPRFGCPAEWVVIRHVKRIASDHGFLRLISLQGFPQPR